MNFRAIFISIVIATGLIVGAFMLNSRRPRVVVEQPSPAFVRASGKCAECHLNTQYSVVHEFEMSAHARRGLNCLDCHQVAQGQKGRDHHGFVINMGATPANCRSCHEPIYQQFVRSRHAAASWAAVAGDKDFTPEQVAFAEKYQPGSVKRAPNPLAHLEGMPATKSGCMSCHSIGKPNDDGSIGACTACHTRHTSSVEFARLPSTCGQCHLGPDHSQLEIYTESKHGAMFAAQRHLLDLKAPPDKLTTRDMFIPTCATCHMSGLNGLGDDARSFGTALVLPFCRGDQGASQCRECTGGDEGGLHAVSHGARRSTGSIRKRRKWWRRPMKKSWRPRASWRI